MELANGHSSPVRVSCRMGPAVCSGTNPRGASTIAQLAGLTFHRDGVSCANLLSQHDTGEPGHVLPPPETYRHPFAGKRSRLDTAEMVSLQTTLQA